MNGNIFEDIASVTNRIDKLKLTYGDRISTFMDLEYSNVDVRKLLSFDDFNFIHDIAGIARNFNRKTKRFDNCFTPRCGFRP